MPVSHCVSAIVPEEHPIALASANIWRLIPFTFLISLIQPISSNL